MCGIQITHNKKENLIKHRGDFHFEGNIHGWEYHFSSLPISSNSSNMFQPIEFKNGYLLFNGEIFNHNDFGFYKSDLHYLKDVFEKGFDSPKFKREYKKWDGFWAICYVDKEGISFFTDPLGKKQLYYNHIGIASEIKPLLDDSKIKLVSRFGTLNTNFMNVKRAMPGKFYRYDKDNLTAYSLDYKINDYLTNESSSKDLYKLIDKSVKLRSVDNYKDIGLLFSGGLDSSIVAHHLVENKIPFTAISINNDESETAKEIAKQIGFDIHFIDDKIEQDEIDKIVYYYESVLDYGSAIPQYLLFKEAKRLGLSTILTGDGADELFSGYTRSLEKDTQEYDVFKELPYYHHIRIDRMSMMHTVEARNPFLSSDIVNYALHLPYSQRKGKKILRDLYSDKFDTSMKKKPLRYKQDKDYNIDLMKETFVKVFK